MPQFYSIVYHEAINKYMERDDWYFVVHMNNGLTTMPVFQSLESFFPGLLVSDDYQVDKVLITYSF